MNMNNENKLKDKKLFDIEYSTQYMKEVKYLDMCGITHTYIKVIKGVPTYKYTKNQELFDALSVFYRNNKF